MITKSVKVLIIAVAVMLVSSPAFAKEGFRLGGGLGVAIPVLSGDVIDDLEPQTGLALGLDLGYGFTEALSLNGRFVYDFGTVDNDWDEDVAYGWMEYAIDVRYAFMTDGQLNPFVMLGVGGNAMAFVWDEDSFDLTASFGPSFGVDLGGGLNYFLNDNWSLGLLAWYTFISYSEVELSGDIDGTIDESTNGGIINMLLTINYTFGQ